MKLTQSAKQSLWVLLIGYVGIFIAAMILYHYLSIPMSRSNSEVKNIARVNQIFHRANQIPRQQLRQLIPPRQARGLRMNISRQAKFPIISKEQFNPKNLLPQLKKNSILNRSVQIKPNTWLNVSLMSPKRNIAGRIVALIVLSLVCLLAIILLGFWAIRRVNYPVQTLLESLNQAKNQQEWMPMPVVGDREQREVITQLNALQRRLHKLLHDRTQMLAAISHDFRTPLTRVKLRAEYWAEHEQYPKLNADIIEMENMIAETLDFFRDTAQEEKTQRFDLVALLESLSNDFKDCGIAVQFETSLQHLTFDGQMNLLKRAFNNLINNAVHYGKQALVSLDTSESKIEITIDDHGKGLSAAEMDQVFKPYHRLENSRSRETGGAGLGLTIAKEVIQQQDGSIELTNLPQGGLRVKVVFNLD